MQIDKSIPTGAQFYSRKRVEGGRIPLQLPGDHALVPGGGDDGFGVCMDTL